jgi:hypothetical protein
LDLKVPEAKNETTTLEAGMPDERPKTASGNTFSVETMVRTKTGNVILLTIGTAEYVLSVAEADKLGAALKSQAFFASENMALRSAWLKCRDVLAQAQSCILGETPEDCSPEEAKEDTLEKIREALS